MPAQRIKPLILAAGGAIRFGSAKQLALINGVPMIRHTVTHILEAGLGPCVVVTGAVQMQIARTLEDLAVTCIHNPQWYEGMAGSIRTGLGWIRQHAPETEGILVALADQPFITGADFRRIREAYDGTCIVAASYPDGPGVPAIFPQPTWADLESLAGDVGARAVIRQNDAVTTVFVSDLRDIDHPGQI
ncbi:MAG: nucleotidyltransferase family protein [Saprospiraceae bacterium]|nr:nucleotidyltransferase family protein [Saprospiraceae bacterium]